MKHSNTTMNTPPPLPTERHDQPVSQNQKWFWVYAIGSSVLILFLLLRHTDNSPRESLGDTKQRTAEVERQAQLARIDGIERQISILRQSITATQAEKAAFSSRMKDYAMDHKLAIAAMGVTVAGAGVALSDGDQFNDDQKTVAGISALVAGLYAISNHEECLEVADRMAKAATMRADYDRRLADAEEQIANLQKQIAQAKRTN